MSQQQEIYKLRSENMKLRDQIKHLENTVSALQKQKQRDRESFAIATKYLDRYYSSQPSVAYADLLEREVVRLWTLLDYISTVADRLKPDLKDEFVQAVLRMVHLRTFGGVSSPDGQVLRFRDKIFTHRVTIEESLQNPKRATPCCDGANSEPQIPPHFEESSGFSTTHNSSL